MDDGGADVCYYLMDLADIHLWSDVNIHSLQHEFHGHLGFLMGSLKKKKKQELGPQV